MVTKHGLLMCRSVRRKPPGEQWSRRETVEARVTKWNFDEEMDSGSGPLVTSRPDEEMPTATARGESPTVSPPAPPPEKHIRYASSQHQRRTRCGGQDEDGDLWLIQRGSCKNEGDWQSRPLHKHS